VAEPIMEEELNTAFFRIFQESLTNVVRHANAKRVDVRMWEQDGNLLMEIRDDGRGISESDWTNTRSIGVLGMRERAVLLGGELTITGAPDRGTTVRVRIPREQPATTESRNHENTHRRRPRSRAAWAETNSGR
jgi:signal transduction histidine kinase